MKTHLTQLENHMLKYSQLEKITVKDNGETFAAVTDVPGGYMPGMSDMVADLGQTIPVRQTVTQCLNVAQNFLQEKLPDYSLYITYGYRSLEVQTSKFLNILQSCTKAFYSNPVDLYEEVHRYVAVPTVAGHPTGGAVDVLIQDIKTQKFLDFGAPIYDFSNKKLYTFFPDISNKAQKNRTILRNCMLQAGFAPYDGEWWHFSYGDREWACYYKKPYALYEQVSLNGMLSNLKIS